MPQHTGQSGDKMDSNWDALHRGVEHLSVTKAATLGGLGSGWALLSGLLPNIQSLNTVFQAMAFATGAIGGILSIVLLILKIVQQRREMRMQVDKIGELERKTYAARKWKGIYGDKD